MSTNKLSNREQTHPPRLGGVISCLSMQEVLNYEIHSHWLASWIGFEWGQDLMARYFAWKVRRKYNRYIISLEERNRVLNEIRNLNRIKKNE